MLVHCEEQLRWLLQHRHEDHSEHRPGRPWSARASGGPVARAFSERFVIVEGTQGTPEDREAIATMSEALRDTWRELQFVDCRVTRDLDLIDEDEAGSNLILVGNGESNALWRKYISPDALDLSDTEVKINGTSYNGRALGVQAVFPHPRDPGRSIVAIGGKDLTEVRFGTTALFLDGWFDYAVWENVDGNPRLLHAGNYGDPSR